MIFTQSSFIFLTQSSFNFYTVQFFLHSPVLVLHGQQSSFIFCVVTRPLSLYCNIQGGKTFCASFCASLIAGSRRAFLCVGCVVAGVLSEVHEVRTFARCKTFFFLTCLLLLRRLKITLDSEQPMLKEKRIIPSV